MGVEWVESYKFGVDELDTVQRELFDLTNAFLESDDLMALRPIIVSLYKQMRKHFELEEALMRSVGFDDLDRHAEQHQMLLTRLLGRSMDVGKGYMNKPAIATLMHEWAVHHVPKEDVKFIEIFISNA